MYPNLYYFFKDVFGVSWPFFKAINSFGLFMVLSFFAAAWALTKEFKRQQKSGVLSYTEETVITGERPTLIAVLPIFLWGGIIGYKFAGFFTTAGAVDDLELAAARDEPLLADRLEELAHRAMVEHLGRRRRVQPSCSRIVIHSDGVCTHKTDGHSQPQNVCRPPTRLSILPVLLKHDSDAITFEPTPSDSASRIPLSRDLECEPFHIKSQGCLDVLHVEEWHRLPDVRSVGGLWFHCGIEECLTRTIHWRTIIRASPLILLSRAVPTLECEQVG